MTLLSGQATYLKRLTGIDRAIAYTIASRVAQIVGSTGTVLLIVRFLTPVEQGYYYTLLSLVALQTIFAMGFSFVILQAAAHECVRLKVGSDGIDGDPVAYSRLASTLQKTLRWYFLATVVMAAILLPVGEVFLSRHADLSSPVFWKGPWVLAVLATALVFFLNPVYSFLEGCGQVRQVAFMRMGQGVAAIIVPWVALMAHRGLYAPGALNAGYSLVGIAFLWSRRRLLMALLRHSPGNDAINWVREVWPFQWRIAVSFTCSYFTIQIFTPILFASRGPVEAGRMGMSMSVAGYLWSVVFSWMSTKASPFGKLVSGGQFAELDRLFFQTLKQSLAVLVVAIAGTMAALVVFQQRFPKLGTRMLPANVFALLLVTAVGTFLVQSFAIYLRSHRFEPFLVQSLVIAALTSAFAWLTVPRWGTTGAAATYLLCVGLIAPVTAYIIFRQKRKARIDVCEYQPL